MRIPVLTVLFLAFPFFAHAAAEVQILPEVTFSKDILYVGDTVRVYATLRNTGDVDVTGDVSFYIGTAISGTPQVISLRAGGVKEEVFVDLLIPEGTFNVRVEVTNVDPPDTNKNDNVVITALATPVPDKDRDGVLDQNDNCPAATNADQKNMDTDTDGDACDADIDGDGLSNEQEAMKGTDPRDVDTDDDGKSDAVDTTPLGEPPPAPKPAPVPPAPAQSPAKTTTTTPPTSADAAPALSSPPAPGEEQAVEVTGDTEASLAEESDETTAQEESEATRGSSQDTKFSFEQVRWSTYNFYAVAPSRDEGYAYNWDFGDDTTSRRREVVHTYAESGEYLVTLKMTSPEGDVVEDQVEIFVPFFDLENGTVRMLLIVLGLAIVLGLVAAYRSAPTSTGVAPASKRPRKKIEPPHA
ncbi:PKD domain-containing protein [Candidatus Uhrbacteria bacterium]|nr:PKD domain-containing protein [Candidatus Uhrbacteria bacterium]